MATPHSTDSLEPLWEPLGIPWGPLGDPLGPLGDPLGTPWGLLGTLGPPLGTPWRALGAFLGTTWGAKSPPKELKSGPRAAESVQKGPTSAKTPRQEAPKELPEALSRVPD